VCLPTIDSLENVTGLYGSLGGGGTITNLSADVVETEAANLGSTV
jgi:hypothetical protein